MSFLWKVLGAGLFSVACGGLLTAGLTEKNPFVWPDFEPPEDRRPARPDPSPQRGEDIEFHAIYELDGVTRALIRDRSNQSFQWVTIGEESDEGVLAKSYNRENDQLLLASSDGERWLDLQSVAAPSGRPSGPVAQRPTPPRVTTGTGSSIRTTRTPTVTTPGTRSSTVQASSGDSVRRPTVSPPRARTRVPPTLRTRTQDAPADLQRQAPAYTPQSPAHLQPPDEGPPSGRPPPP